MSARDPQTSSVPVLAGWLAIAVTTLALSIPHVEVMGMYYDEAFLAQQARDFVEPEHQAVHPPSVTTLYFSGRPFPLRNAAYLGSLKSQLLMPSLAVFGSSSRVVRITTLATALLALLFAMLWAQQLFDRDTALLMGLLVAADPSFHFFGQFEWGPFTTLFLCRSIGLFSLGVAFRAKSRSLRWVACIAGGAFLGLGIYSRADFAVIVFAAAAALLLCRRDLVATAWNDLPGPLVAGAVALVVTASPTLIVTLDVLIAGQGMSERGDWLHRARVMQASLDGSQFHRVVGAGGLFDELFSRAAPATGSVAVLTIAAVTLLLLSRGSRRANAGAFSVTMLVILGATMLMIPGAVRAHHMLNVIPLPQLVVAAAGVGIWRREWRTHVLRNLARVSVLVCLAASLIANFSVISKTRALLAETGGRGRFSHALDALAAELDATSDAGRTVVVSLDWGFHENVSFLTERVQTTEVTWRFASGLAQGRPSVIEGSRNHVYLAHAPRYELVPFGSRFLRAVAALDSEGVEVRHHEDRLGEHVFTTVRFDGPHRIIFDGGFRIER